MEIYVLIAAHNESATIGLLIDAIHDACRNDYPTAEAHIFVCDDRSTDDTRRIAIDHGAKVITTHKSKRHGKGQALNTFAESFVMSADVVVLLDADLVTTPAQIAALIQPCANSQADLCIGVLPHQEGARGFGFVKRLALTELERRGYPRLTAPLSGQRALTARAYAALFPVDPGYSVETLMNIRAFDAGLTVREVPFDAQHRAHNLKLKSMIHKAHQYLDIKRALRTL